MRQAYKSRYTSYFIQAKLYYKQYKIFNNTYMRPYFNHFFEVGIKVHVGKVIVGNVGIGLSDNLTVMGFPVNIAARLQAAAKELNNNFVISERAYRLLKNPPHAVGCGYLNLKGVSNAYEVKLIGKPYRTIPDKAMK